MKTARAFLWEYQRRHQLGLIVLAAYLLTFLVVQAFGAAAVGAFASIPLTFAGGVLIGIAADLSKHFLIEQPSLTWLSGIPGSLPFIVLFVALLVLPKRKLVPPSTIEHRPKLQWRGPPLLPNAGVRAISCG